MENKIIYQIAKDIKSNSIKVIRVNNTDGFLLRHDVMLALSNFGIIVLTGSNLDLRIKYELRDNNQYYVLISENNDYLLPDIKANSVSIDWSLEKYFPFLHLPSIIDIELNLLDQLFAQHIITPVDKLTTQTLLKNLNHVQPNNNDNYQLNELSEKITRCISEHSINWSIVARNLGKLINLALKNEKLQMYNDIINDVNTLFQNELRLNYSQIKNSSSAKKPKIVSKILDYISFNYFNDKVALIVIDGMAFWQFYLLKENIEYLTKEDTIYSWIPSITQLSRQAIFRGENPHIEYKQGPVNERKIWNKYWIDKGIPLHLISYNHSSANLEDCEKYSKIAIVYKDLDDKMHSSDDYIDLYDLTLNWRNKTSLFNDIEILLKKNFKIFLTTDHGNIEAKAWRALIGREKLGTNKSGSRSERHIEYSDNWLMNELFSKNPDLADYVVSEENALYFKNNLSFSSKETLVTHGGAHVLEVLIPFVEIIKNEK